MLNFLFGALFVMVLCTVYGAEPSLQNTLISIWNSTDTNANGIMERSELDNVLYNTYDGNHNKQVILAEFLHVYGDQNPQAGKNIFNIMDMNNDGHWDHTDFDAIYAAMDKNHDHRVTEAEAKEWITNMFVKAGFVTPHVG